MIKLMDDVLRRNNLDLRLTHYRVIATSRDTGFVELVPDCITVHEVIERHKQIIDYLKLLSANSTSAIIDPTVGVAHEIMQNFVKSCAGYSIVAYLLGIGDRHNENILITNSGCLFHIDFGFILGADPKKSPLLPAPPPMPVTKEIVAGMGGPKTSYYTAFKIWAGEAFRVLRREANLIMALFSLMIDAVPQLSGDRAQIRHHLRHLEESFLLHMSDDRASESILWKIYESENSWFPSIADTAHRVAQQLRK